MLMKSDRRIVIFVWSIPRFMVFVTNTWLPNFQSFENNFIYSIWAMSAHIMQLDFIWTTVCFVIMCAIQVVSTINLSTGRNSILGVFDKKITKSSTQLERVSNFGFDQSKVLHTHQNVKSVSIFSFGNLVNQQPNINVNWNTMMDHPFGFYIFLFTDLHFTRHFQMCQKNPMKMGS